jgi:hypothetical protein
LKLFGKASVSSLRAMMRPAVAELGQNWGLLTHPQSHTLREQTHPQNSGFTPRCPSVVLWTPCSGVEWGVFEPTIRVWRAATTPRKQPVNLTVEGAEESLSILTD